MLEVTNAEYLHDYIIKLDFNDGTHGKLDFEGLLWGTMFEPLKELDTFKAFHLSQTFHTICWPNEADFAPEFLKEKMTEQNGWM